MGIRIVKALNRQQTNLYAVCECTTYDEVIEIPRKENVKWLGFNCPRCGKELGIVVGGDEEWI